MIRVSKLISRAEGEAPRLAVSEVSGVTIPVRDIDRAVAFYSRVFGLKLARAGGPLPRRSATLAGADGARLAMHERVDAAERLPLARAWGFLVDDLDRVREAAWDLGVKVANDNGEPDHIRRWANGRSLAVRDPDGNQIELIEECRRTGAGAARRKCPVRAAWRRRMHPASCNAG